MFLRGVRAPRSIPAILILFLSEYLAWVISPIQTPVWPTLFFSPDSSCSFHSWTVAHSFNLCSVGLLMKWRMGPRIALSFSDQMLSKQRAGKQERDIWSMPIGLRIRCKINTAPQLMERRTIITVVAVKRGDCHDLKDSLQTVRYVWLSLLIERRLEEFWHGPL